MKSNTTLRPLGALLAGLVMAAGLTLLPASPASAVDVPTPHAVAQLDQSYEFTWDEAQGASAYRLEVATDPNFSTVLESVNTYSRVYDARVDYSASDARTLYWRVAAYGSGITPTTLGAWSDTQSFAVDAYGAPAPTAPADGATFSYPTAQSFRWDAAPHAQSYQLEIAPNGDFSAGNVVKVPADTSKLTTRGYTPTTPLAAGSWSWRVRAVSTSSTAETVYSPWSTVRSFTVSWPAAASTPTQLTPANGATLADPYFSWTAVPGASDYTLVVSRAADLSNPLINTTVADAIYSPSSELPTGQYFWRVTANDLSGNSGSPSALWSFNRAWGTTGDPASVGSPAPTTTDGYSKDYANPTEVPLDQLRLSWTAVPRATYYRVIINTVPTDPRYTITCRTSGTSLTPVLTFAQGQYLSYLKGLTACTGLADSLYGFKALAPGTTVSYTVQPMDLPGSSTTAFNSGDSAAIPGNTSTESYIKVLSRAATTDPDPSGIITQDSSSWNAQLTNGSTVAPSPTFSWTPVVGAAAYDVQVYRANTNNVIATVRTTSNSLTIPGVFSNDNADVYLWSVRALSSLNPVTYMGATGWGNQPTLQWKRSTAATVIPQNYTITNADSSMLTWTDAYTNAPAEGGSRGYEVDYRPVGSGDTGWNNTSPTNTIKVDSPYWVPRNPKGEQLQDGTYDFRVAALDANGDPGSYSPTQQFTVAQPVPTGLAVDRDGATFHLSWSPSGKTGGYQVRWRKDGGSWTTYPNATGYFSQTAYDFTPPTGQIPGAYEFQVRSLGSGSGATQAWGAWSSVTPLTVADPSVAQATPNNAVLPTSDRTLRWTAVPGASRYLVQMSTSSASVSSARPVEVVGTSYTPDAASPIPNMTPTVPYYWRVQAIAEPFPAAVTTSNRSILATSPVQTFYVVTPPKGVNIIAATPASGTEIALTWSALTGANAGTNEGASYVVRYRQAGLTPPPDWNYTAPTSINASALTVGNLTQGTSYEFQLQAVNSEGSSVWSASKTASTADVPTAPQNLSVSASDYKSLVLTWRTPASAGNSPITGYHVRWKTASGAWKNASTGVAYTYTITGLTETTTYDVEVTAVNAVGDGQAAVGQGTTLKDPTPVAQRRPAAPTKVTLKAAPGKTTVSWNASVSTYTPVTKYTVQYSLNKTKWVKLADVKVSQARTLTTAKGTKKKPIYFRIAATNSYGMGAWSAVKGITKK